MLDLVGVFILSTATEALKQIRLEKPQEALKALSACTIGSCQFLQPKDIIFKQIYVFVEKRVIKASQNSDSCKKLAVAFNLLMDKLKLFKDGKSDQLRQDFVPGTLDATLANEI